MNGTRVVGIIMCILDKIFVTCIIIRYSLCWICGMLLIYILDCVSNINLEIGIIKSNIISFLKKNYVDFDT